MRMLLPKLVNKTSLHKFTLTFNKLNRWLCVFSVLSEERAPSSIIVPEPGVLPSPGERGPSLAFSPDPESSPKILYRGTAAKSKSPPKLYGLGLMGCWTLLVVVLLCLEGRSGFWSVCYCGSVGGGGCRRWG